MPHRDKLEAIRANTQDGRDHANDPIAGVVASVLLSLLIWAAAYAAIVWWYS